MRPGQNAIFHAIKEVISRKSYFIIFLLSSIGFFSIFILLQVLAIPGNTVLYQLSVYAFRDFALLVAFSIMASLVATMHIFIYNTSKSVSIGRGATGGVSSLIASFFGTVMCGSCIVTLFAFLGSGLAFFLAKQQWKIASIAIGLLAFSLYLTSVKVNEVCEKRSWH